MSSPPRILVAGVGNSWRGDDAVGLEVAQALSTLLGELEHVRVLATEAEQSSLLDEWEGCDSVLIIDAVHSAAPADGPRGAFRSSFNSFCMAAIRSASSAGAHRRTAAAAPSASSVRWTVATASRPGSSRMVPAPYATTTVTSGRLPSSDRMTRKPFFSLYSWNSKPRPLGRASWPARSRAGDRTRKARTRKEPAVFVISIEEALEPDKA